MDKKQDNFSDSYALLDKERYVEEMIIYFKKYEFKLLEEYYVEKVYMVEILSINLYYIFKIIDIIFAEKENIAKQNELSTQAIFEIKHLIMFLEEDQYNDYFINLKKDIMKNLNATSSLFFWIRKAQSIVEKTRQIVENHSQNFIEKIRKEIND